MNKMSLLLKGAVLLVLALLLLIPLSMVKGLIYERMARHQQVETEIANSTAQPQILAGPIVALHFTEYWTDSVVEKKTDGDKQWSETRDLPRQSKRVHYVLPSQMVVSGSLAVEERHRGIFSTQVYHYDGRLEGKLVFPKLASLVSHDGGKVKLTGAYASILFGDRKGILAQPVLTLGGKPYNFEPGTHLVGASAGIAADISASVLANQNQMLDFSVPLQLQGTKAFSLVPLASDNRLSLDSAWPHPAFNGAFLPTTREVTDEGFRAEWRVTSMASSAPSQILGALASKKISLWGTQSMGVSLAEPVSVYSVTDRALKYGFLFVGLTFASFFLYELLARLRIHPVQYGLVGVAQALFFLLLLSLSEHLGFAVAYLLATTGCVGLICFYLSGVLGSWHRASAFAGALGGLYAVLYLLLQSEDYALLGGSLVLFGLLTGAMLVSRKVDWYALESGGKGTTCPDAAP